jgi:SAM-dependent methyltransferase
MLPSDYQPTERFSGLAGSYSQYRPAYPAAALDFVMSRCGLNDRSVLVDLGCGTGISSRLFAARGIQVIGIEPNADMRQQAESESLPAGVPIPRYQSGRAEATRLSDASADAVLAAQAFHWFEPEATLREFHRILKPNGWVILLWNQRDESDPFTRAYGAGVRRLTDAEVFEPCHGKGDALLKSPLFEDGELAFFSNEQVLDEISLLGRAFSVSYAPRDDASAKRYADELRDIFRGFQKDGRVTMRYETSVFLARRR